MSEENGRRPTVLITGASGYIGGRLATRLTASGWKVHAVVRPTSATTAATAACAGRIVYDGTQGSLTPAVDRIRPDLAIHLASEFQQDETAETTERLILSNLLFPVHLVEALLAVGCTKLVNTGTFWQHYLERAYLPVDLYAATKQSAEDLLLYFHDARGLSCITMTLFDTYGPADPRRKLINLILDAAEKDQPLCLSPGDQILDITHVEDVVDAFCLAAQAVLEAREPRWEKVFVSGERMSLKALVDLVSATLKAPLDVEFGARAYKPREIMVPIAPAASALLASWTPRRRLQDELVSLLRSREERIDAG